MTYREGIDLFLKDIGGADKADVVAFKTELEKLREQVQNVE